MDSKRNNIQKVVFEVEYYDKSSAQFMQNKIINEFNLNTSTRIDEIFNEKTQGYHIKAKNIVLDLGVISRESCETVLTSLIEDKLNVYLDALRKRLEVRDIPVDIEVEFFVEKLYEYLYNYFQYGRVDWNVEYFSEENSIDYWMHYLSVEDPVFFNSLLSLFLNHESRVRFLNAIPIHRNTSLVKNIFPVHIAEILLKAAIQLTKILEFYNKPDKELIIGNFLLFLSGYMSSSPGNESSKSYLPSVFYNFLQSSDSFKPEIILQILRSQVFQTASEKVFVNEISRLYFTEKTASSDFYIIVPEEIAEAYNNWSVFVHNIEQKIPAWSKILIKRTRELVNDIKQEFDKRDEEKIGKLIRKLILESIYLSEFPKDIELWKGILTERCEKILGKDSIEKVQKMITEVTNESPEIIKSEKSISKFMDKITYEDAGVTYQIDLDSTLRYLKLMSTIGLRGLTSYFKNPVSVLIQLFKSLKLYYPRYYKSELRKFSQSISLSEFNYVFEQVAANDIKQDLMEASEYRDVYKILVEFKDNLGGFLLIDILTGHYIPVYIIIQIGISRIAAEIRKFVKVNKVPLEDVIKSLDIKADIQAMNYLEKISDANTYQTVLEILNIKKEETEISSYSKFIDVIIRFQLGIGFLLSGNLSSKQIKEFEAIIKTLIDSRNNEFAKFIIALEEGDVKKIKAILPGAYCTKIDNVRKQFENNLLTKTEERQEEPLIKIAEGESIYIRNSGLIILNPYLNTLFTRLGYVEDKKFISDYSRSKAIRTMHYLVTRTTAWEEPDIILNKILAGLYPTDIIEVVDEMTKDEMDMCEGLLEAVLKNWGALKNTSPDSLRGGFFIRNGKLSFELSNWRLIVERKSYDVLLDKLPWSFSTIKLPWMQYPLITDW